MKGRLIGILTCASVLLSTAAFAADSAMFITKCGGCHKKGGEAAPVNPADKAGVVWDKFFKRERHPVNISGSIAAGDLEIVVQYLVAHAADSDQPEAAAIPK
ncbi:MAG: hypothetical protein COZ12_04540 [Deltaproteobacteria bacterium CG_4_10_14_3_um_filter_60_8]|nr:MAG: hypothetical protein AUK28_08270 [Desulfobacterales bacterium CG2_30_60_27]PIP43620.1 MAG: hypothetical protein COX17_06000 [Deltaproteobacteria bacterium CG23_combo_of_CG06-09_8_20_14_all_60_8]PIY21497.1 MAG: hypothetical protein COZ12_04540 [Deltaproteobacteria bacterium CG_4_10_14_3_um_filter_60_8]